MPPITGVTQSAWKVEQRKERKGSLCFTRSTCTVTLHLSTHGRPTSPVRVGVREDGVTYQLRDGGPRGEQHGQSTKSKANHRILLTLAAFPVRHGAVLHGSGSDKGCSMYLLADQSGRVAQVGGGVATSSQVERTNLSETTPSRGAIFFKAYREGTAASCYFYLMGSKSATHLPLVHLRRTTPAPFAGRNKYPLNQPSPSPFRPISTSASGRYSVYPPRHFW